MFLKVILFFCYVVLSEATSYEGDRCFKNGVTGVCTKINRCQSAITDIRNRKNPQICSFDNADPIVCCLDSGTAANLTSFNGIPLQKWSQTSTSTTTEAISNEEGECEALSPEMTPEKTGQKAFDKCIEYQERFIYPCEESASILGDLARSNNCFHNTDDLIIGGTDASQYEFPHMVMLGYGKGINQLQWMCGGTLISERFILTAGHCIASRHDPVSYALIGALRRSDTADRSKIYKVKNIIKHPDYKSPLKYNDIALIETEKQIKLNQFTVPACLHTGDQVDDAKVLATGWGLTQDNALESIADTLQKVILIKFSSSECSQRYKPARLMKQGFVSQSQMCYGDDESSPVYNNKGRDSLKDTCQGDSGGPIQIKSKNIHCMYTVVGVTSFGKGCGKNPGIYTKVANYIPWIESIVWP